MAYFLMILGLVLVVLSYLNYRTANDKEKLIREVGINDHDFLRLRDAELCRGILIGSGAVLMLVGAIKFFS